MLHLRNLQCEATCELPYYSVNNISTVDVHYNLYGQMQLAAKFAVYTNLVYDTERCVQSNYLK